MNLREKLQKMCQESVNKQKKVQEILIDRYINVTIPQIISILEEKASKGYTYYTFSDIDHHSKLPDDVVLKILQTYFSDLTVTMYNKCDDVKEIEFEPGEIKDYYTEFTISWN
jgi:hypothetical protein